MQFLAVFGNGSTGQMQPFGIEIALNVLIGQGGLFVLFFDQLYQLLLNIVR